ncbi:T9SS type A sorting domain-containing protein [candidate division WOR-3 bacterium]|nr:T9SS type A sorting domain-containing protein [candidate division WOR-3 bacterium]
MRKSLLLLLALVLLPAGLWAAERMVLAELLTSTTCGPCYSGNARLDGILLQKGDYLAVIRVHMNWPSPGNDPFYSYISATNNTRRNMYNINSIPTIVIDGVAKYTNISGDMWAPGIDDRHATESPLELNIYRTFTPSSYLEGETQGSGEVTIEIINEGGQLLSFKLYGALVVNDVEYTGTNGDPEHDQVLFAMLPKPSETVGLNGTDVTIAKNATKTLTMEYDIYDSIMFPPLFEDGLIVSAENCQLVFWCQKSGVGETEVLQAAKVNVVGYSDFDLSNPLVAPQDGKLDAGEQANVHVTINNNSDVELQDVVVKLEVADEDITVVNGRAVAQSVEAGGSYTIEGDQLMIEAGAGYDGSGFELEFWAGSGDGSIAPEFKQTYVPGVAEDILPRRTYSLVAPSIVTDQGLVSFSTPNAENVEITLYDACGRTVRKLCSGVSGSGSVTVSALELTNGVYFIKATLGNWSKVERLLVIH